MDVENQRGLAVKFLVKSLISSPWETGCAAISGVLQCSMLKSLDAGEAGEDMASRGAQYDSSNVKEMLFKDGQWTVDSVTVFSFLIVRRAGSSVQAKSSNHLRFHYNKKHFLLSYL